LGTSDAKEFTSRTFTSLPQVDSIRSINGCLLRRLSERDGFLVTRHQHRLLLHHTSRHTTPHLLHRGPLRSCCLTMTPSQKFLIYTDNSNVVDIFSSLHCRPEFNNIIKYAVSACVKADIDMRVLHIPGDENSVADAISRADFDRARNLSPNISFHNFSPPFPSKKPPHTQPPHSTLGATEK
jgi:hypothetical protein